MVMLGAAYCCSADSLGISAAGGNKVERAQETEINTGPARKPGTAAAAAVAARDDSDGYDPDDGYDPMAAADEVID